MSIEQPSRRAVIKAGAWTAPVIVIAAAAPAAAASGTPMISLAWIGEPEYPSEGSGRRIQFTITRSGEPFLEDSIIYLVTDGETPSEDNNFYIVDVAELASSGTGTGIFGFQPRTYRYRAEYRSNDGNVYFSPILPPDLNPPLRRRARR